MRPTPYVASLRIYEPLSAFEPADRLRWQNLESVFKKYDDEALNIAGLVLKNDQGKRYDRFRDRIIFPIHNMKGEIIGFGGRVINPEDTPKYYNSPETPLFQKSQELYGLFAARRSIREKASVLVVEGYMDVVGLAQFGVMNAVATLGTATSAFHIKKLRIFRTNKKQKTTDIKIIDKKKFL